MPPLGHKKDFGLKLLKKESFALLKKVKVLLVDFFKGDAPHQ